MDLRNLRDFLSGGIDGAALHSLVSGESSLFGRRIDAGEISVPLYGSHGAFHFTVRVEHVHRMVQDYQSGSLSGWDVYYMADLIKLCPAFSPSNEYVEEAIYRLADPTRQMPMTTTDAGALSVRLLEGERCS